MRGGCSSMNSTKMRSPSLPDRSSGVLMKKTSPPPEAALSCSRSCQKTSKVCFKDSIEGKSLEEAHGSFSRKRRPHSFTNLGFLLDVLEQRGYGVRAGVGQRPMGEALHRRSVEITQAHRAHMRLDERCAQLDNGSRMLNEIPAADFQT